MSTIERPAASRPRVRVSTRQRYAEVVIDLWPCDYDLNEEGAQVCLELLESAARRASSKQRSVYFSAGGSIVQITRVRREEVDELAEQLLAVVLDERHQEPLRIFDEGEEPSAA